MKDNQLGWWSDAKPYLHLKVQAFIQQSNHILYYLFHCGVVAYVAHMPLDSNRQNGRIELHLGRKLPIVELERWI